MGGMIFSMVQIWLAVGIILIVAEVMTTTFFLLWPAIAAFIVALLCWIFPEFALIGQLLVFAFVSAILLIPGRRAIAPFFKKDNTNALNDRMTRMIGQKASVVAIDGDNLRVKLGDTEWSAVSNDTLMVGQIVAITQTKGNVLVVAVT